jgi:hypothetical protein
MGLPGDQPSHPQLHTCVLGGISPLTTAHCPLLSSGVAGGGGDPWEVLRGGRWLKAVEGLGFRGNILSLKSASSTQELKIWGK